MMTILFVDDDYSKIQRVAGALGNEVREQIQIEHVTDGATARLRLQQREYDLLLIDLHLPEAVGQAPCAEGGMRFLDLLFLDEDAYLPAEIVFISARQELYEEARASADIKGVQIIFCSAEKTEWLRQLEAILLRHQKHHERCTARSKKIDIAIITALHSPEAEAVLKLDYAWKVFNRKGDPSTYYVGEVHTASGKRSVVCVSPARKGMAATATVATKMMHLFRPRFLMMVGICAGIAGKTQVGDIVIADPTWDWGAGKYAEKEDGSTVFKTAPHQLSLEPMLRKHLLELTKSAELRQKIRSGWQKDLPPSPLEARVGPMGSGASVIAAAELADLIKDQNKDIVAIEMEAYAVMTCCEHAALPRPLPMVIKSVCDFADSNKNDAWQEYASYTAAAFADHVLRHDFLDALLQN